MYHILSIWLDGRLLHILTNQSMNLAGSNPQMSPAAGAETVLGITGRVHPECVGILALSHSGLWHTAQPRAQ